MHKILSSGERTITDILFRSEVNSMTFKSSYFSSYPDLILLMTILFEASLSSNTRPKYLAPFVRANSSGEEALYVSLPSSDMFGTIVWQTAKIVMNF